MTNPLILYENLWRDGEILACSSELAQFPAENTQDDSPQIYWRSVDASGTITIDIDLGAAREYDLISIRSHNLTSGATIQLIGADDAAFTTNPVTDTLIHNSDNLTEILATARTKRYVRISLADVSNPNGYLKIGTVVLGKGNALNQPVGSPDQDGYINETEPEIAPSGVVFIVQESPSRESKILPFFGLDDASKATIKELTGECALGLGFLICLNSASPNSETFWVRLVSLELSTRSSMGYWSFNMTIEAML